MVVVIKKVQDSILNTILPEWGSWQGSCWLGRKKNCGWSMDCPCECQGSGLLGFMLLVSDDDDRAVRILHHVVAHRTKNGLLELAQAAGTHQNGEGVFFLGHGHERMASVLRGDRKHTAVNLQRDTWWRHHMEHFMYWGTGCGNCNITTSFAIGKLTYTKRINYQN